MIIPSVKFVFDRKKTAGNAGLGAVELRIDYDRKHKYMATGIKVQKGRWDENNQCVTGIADAKQYNLIISRMRTRVLEILADMDKEGTIDLAAIPSRMKVKSQDMTFLEFIELQIAKSENTAAHNTTKGYKTFLTQITNWGKIRFFSDVTRENITKLDDWLHERKLGDETIYGYHKHMRKFINDALRAGYISQNPYMLKAVKLKHGKPNIQNYITEKELEKIKKADVGSKSLEGVRDVFVFQCLTGLSFSDMEVFKASRIKEIDGYKTYSGKRGKTGVPFLIVLLDDAMELLEKYGGKFPKMTNQQYNMRLKVIAEAAKVNKPLTSHWARHTAATIWFNRGVPIEVVSKMLGHSNTRITEGVYSKMLDQTIVKAMSVFAKEKDGEE